MLLEMEQYGLVEVKMKVAAQVLEVVWEEKEVVEVPKILLLKAKQEKMMRLPKLMLLEVEQEEEVVEVLQELK